MRLLLALLALAAAPAFAQPAPFEIRFHPTDRVYAYPLDEHGRYRSVQLQNAAIINRTGEPIAIAGVEIELLSPPSVIESRRFEGAELDRAAKAGSMMQSSGMLELLRFQFGGEALVPAGVRMADSAVLQPNESLLLARQMFAMRGTQTELRVRVRGLASGQLFESTASLRILSAESANAYRFPLQGVWYVGAGPSIHSHHRTVVAQEYALDLIQLQENGRTHRGDGTRRGDFRAYGAKVMAAADGRVVAAVGDQDETDEDLRRPGEALEAYMSRVRQAQMGRIGRGTNAVIGNHVVIAHAGGEHSVYAHLKPGSVRVKAGDAVRAGDLLGEVGTSGNSTEPHLHFHVCNGAEPLLCAGIPVKFEGLEMPLADSPRALQTGDVVVGK